MTTTPFEQQPTFDVPIVVTFVVKQEATDLPTATTQAQAVLTQELASVPWPYVDISAGTVTTGSVVPGGTGSEAATSDVASPE